MGDKLNPQFLLKPEVQGLPLGLINIYRDVFPKQTQSLNSVGSWIKSAKLSMSPGDLQENHNNNQNIMAKGTEMGLYKVGHTQFHREYQTLLHSEWFVSSV